MQGKEMYNPIQMVNPENCSYILLATIIPNDNEEEPYCTWFFFESRNEIYGYIKDNLESDEEILDIDHSYILMSESQIPKEMEEMPNVSGWMVAVAPMYGDTFDPKHYAIER